MSFLQHVSHQITNQNTCQQTYSCKTIRHQRMSSDPTHFGPKLTGISSLSSYSLLWNAGVDSRIYKAAYPQLNWNMAHASSLFIMIQASSIISLKLIYYPHADWLQKSSCASWETLTAGALGLRDTAAGSVLGKGMSGQITGHMCPES